MEIMVIMEVIESKVFFHNVFKNYLFREKKNLSMKFQVIELRIQVNLEGMPKIEEKNLGARWKNVETSGNST